MIKRKIAYHLSAIVTLVLALAITCFASTDKGGSKKFSFTTKSKEAKGYAIEAMNSIETFQFGPQLLPLAKKAVEADPNFAFGHYLLATVYIGSPEAKPHADRAVELAKNASEGERRYIEAVLLIRSQQADKGLPILLELANQYPEERMVHMMLGQVYVMQNKPDEAKTAFERALKLDGSTPRVYSFLGNIYLIKGDFRQAREMFRASLSRKKEGTAAGGPAYGLAFTHLYEGDLQSALNTLTAFREEYNRTPGAADFPPVFVWNSIGRLLLENGRADESLEAYEEGYKAVPSSPISERDKKLWLGRFHHGRGRALAKMGRHDDAWKEADLIKKMIDEAGDEGKEFWPAYHYLVGYIKLEKGEYAKAVEHLKQSDLNDPFQKLLLARAYEKTGDTAAAQKLYREILESSQNSMERALAYPEAKRKLKG